MRDAAKRHDRLKFPAGLQRLHEEGSAVANFSRGRLVLGRDATYRIGDAAIVQHQTVVGPLVVDAGREAVPDQGFKEQVACPIASERTAGSIGSAQAGREPDN